MSHYIDEQTGEVFGYEKRAGLTPCEVPPDNHDWDTVTKSWIPNQAKIFESTAQQLTGAVSKHLDAKAQEFRYDDMKSARSYAGYANAFQAEALTLANWSSVVWAYMDTVEADVLAETRTIPTVEELLAELPIYGA